MTQKTIKRRKTERRTRMLTLRLTEREFAALMAEADRNDSTVSAVMLGFLYEGLAFFQIDDASERDEIAALRREMRTIGVNLNLTARAMDAGLVPRNSEIAEGVAAALDVLKKAEAGWSALVARRAARRRTSTGHEKP